MSPLSGGPRGDRPPFTRQIDVDTIPDTGLNTSIEATNDECVAVARDVGLPSILSLSAQFEIAHRPGGRFQVQGAVSARIIQVCVVSLDTFGSEIDQPIDMMFAPSLQPVPDRRGAGARRLENARRRDPAREAPVPMAASERDEDPPDPIIDDRIDLGAVAVEFLTLALDFYPRKPGVHFSDVLIGEPGPNPSAFAALERLKDRS